MTLIPSVSFKTDSLVFLGAIISTARDNAFHQTVKLGGTRGKFRADATVDKLAYELDFPRESKVKIGFPQSTDSTTLP